MSNPAPHLNADAIDRRAERVLRYFCPEVLQSPSIAPINHIVSEARRFGLGFGAPSDLGYSGSGAKILGCFHLTPPTIQIDECLLDDVRLPFVIAHEFGHCILHRNLQLLASDYPVIRETELDLATGHKALITTRDWIEWQANRFASALLMPRTTVREALCGAQERLSISVARRGRIFLDGADYNYRDFEKLKNILATTYGVNKTNVEYRLRALDLIDDD